MNGIKIALKNEAHFFMASQFDETHYLSQTFHNPYIIHTQQNDTI